MKVKRGMGEGTHSDRRDEVEEIWRGEEVSLSRDEIEIEGAFELLTFFRNSSAQIRALALRVIFISLISLSISSINCKRYVGQERPKQVTQYQFIYARHTWSSRPCNI